MALSVKIYSPAGAEYDITNRIKYDDNPARTMRYEEASNVFIVDDLSLTLRNATGYFSGLWTLPLDPTLRTNESTGISAWKIVVTRGATQIFEGDLVPSSVDFITEDDVVETLWAGAGKRTEKDGDGIKRAIPDPLSFTCVRHNRKLTFDVEVASLYLEVEDRIKCSALRQNARIIDQELEIRELGPTATLTNKQVRVRQGVKKAYTEGAVVNPYYKTTDETTLTVEDCVGLVLDELGVAAGKRQIAGTGIARTVDEFKTKGKSCSEILTDLAKYSGSVWSRHPDGTYYFVGRNWNKSTTPKNLDTGGPGGTTLFTSLPIQAASEEWFDSVIITGQPPHFAPDSPPRKYRHGSGHARPYELEVEYTSSLATLQEVAEEVYAAVCKQRVKATATVKDDGTTYALFDRVTFGGRNWKIIEITEPLEATIHRSEIALTFLSEDGTTPSATGSEWDYNDDDDAPFPVTDMELGKATDAPGSRPAWFSEARSQYPGGINEFPIKRPDHVVDDDDNPRTPPKVVWKRLWFLRFKPMDPDDDPPDGFIITVFTPSKGIGKPLQEFAYNQPEIHTDGYYYVPVYLAARVGAPEKVIVVRTWNARRDLSAYSDEVSTADWGGATDDDSPFAGVTMTIQKLATEEYSNTYRISFTETSSGDPIVIPELEKIRVAKSTSTATSPDLTRLQPKIDCLDYTTDPAICTESTFETVVSHAKNATPRVWFQAVSFDGHKMDWAFDSADGAPDTPAPVITEVLFDAISLSMKVKMLYSGPLPEGAKIWCSTNGTYSTTAQATVVTFDETGPGYVVGSCSFHAEGGSNAVFTKDLNCYFKAKFEYTGDLLSEDSTNFYHTASVIVYPQPTRYQISYDSGTGIATTKWTFPNAIVAGDNIYGFALWYNNGSPSSPTTTCDGTTPALYSVPSGWAKLGTTPFTFQITTTLDGSLNVFEKTFNVGTGLTSFSIVLCSGDNSTKWSSWCALPLHYEYVAPTPPPTPSFVLISGSTYKISWTGFLTVYWIHLKKAFGISNVWMDVIAPETDPNAPYLSGTYTFTGTSGWKYMARLCRVPSDPTGQPVDNQHGEWAELNLTSGGGGSKL